MARSAIVINSIVRDTGKVLTETALTNGATGASGYSITSVKKDYNVELVIKNTGSATGALTIKAGDFAAASTDLTESVGAGVTKAFVINGAKYLNQDATISVDSGITGTMYATQR